jgi:hypothetical protein
MSLAVLLNAANIDIKSAGGGGATSTMMANFKPRVLRKNDFHAPLLTRVSQRIHHNARCINHVNYLSFVNAKIP